MDPTECPLLALNFIRLVKNLNRLYYIPNHEKSYKKFLKTLKLTKIKFQHSPDEEIFASSRGWMFLGDPAHQGQEPEHPLEPELPLEEVSENDSELSAVDGSIEEITPNTETENVEISETLENAEIFETPESAETENQISDQTFEDLVSELSEETASEESEV